MSNGWVDVVDGFQVAGWALEDDGKTPARVTIYLDGEELATISPTIFRPDLRDAKLGDGWSGFRFYFPTPIGIDKPARVTVRLASSGKVLGGYADSIKMPSLYGGLEAHDDVDVYAAAAMSATRHEAPGDGPQTFTVSALALAPRNTTIRFASELRSVEIYELDTTRRGIARLPREALLPEHAPLLNTISFKVRGLDPNSKFAVFDLVEGNMENAGFGKKPINPVARMCVPLSTDWLTLPSEEHFRRTCGPGNTENSFVVSGMTAAYQISCIAGQFLDSEPTTILDWGVGCGRIALPMKRGLWPRARVLGVDIDGVNVDWCKKNIPDVEVSLGDFFPPLDIDSSSIDLIYGISVMTHLTDHAQTVWLEELRRILKPGGLCILSTLGEYSLVLNPTLDSLVIRELYANGISSYIVDENLGPSLKLKDYYRLTYQLRRQVEEKWSKCMDIVAYYTAAIGGVQNAVVMRKTA